MPWTDLTFAFEQVLTSDEMNNLDANFDALAAGDAGAPGIKFAAVDFVLDEDDMASDSAAAVPTQQSVKAYVDGFNGAGLIPLASATASDDAAVDFTSNINSTYDHYVFIIDSLRPATNGANFELVVSDDGGVTWDEGASDYEWSNLASDVDSTSALVNQNASAPEISLTADMSNAAGEKGSLTVHVMNPAGGQSVIVYGTMAWVLSDSNMRSATLGGRRITAKAIDAIRFQMNSGNITNGQFRLYGVKKL